MCCYRKFITFSVEQAILLHDTTLALILFLEQHHVCIPALITRRKWKSFLNQDLLSDSEQRRSSESMQCVSVSHHQPLKARLAAEGQQSIKKKPCSFKELGWNRQRYEWDQSLTKPGLWNPTLRISKALPSNANLFITHTVTKACLQRDQCSWSCMNFWSNSYRAGSDASYFYTSRVSCFALKRTSIAVWDSGWYELNTPVLIQTLDLKFYSKCGFTSLWDERLPSKRGVPPLKSAALSLTKVCIWPQGQRKSPVVERFMVQSDKDWAVWIQETQVHKKTGPTVHVLLPEELSHYAKWM